MFLCLAAVQLVQSEREGGKILAYGIPVWAIQLIMPIGFGIIALRILRHASETWTGTIHCLDAGRRDWFGLVFIRRSRPRNWVVPGLLNLLMAVVLGAPIFVMLGGAALILFWGEDLPIASISLTHYSMVTNPTFANRSSVYARRIFSRGRRRVEKVDPRFPGIARLNARRPGHRDGFAVCVLHFVHGRVGRHHSRAGRVADAGIDQRRAASPLAWPQTYYNDSGIAVATLARRYDLLEEVGRIIVVHDELDLRPGRLKVKVGGGLAGNNGLRSIKAHLHTDEFVRVRIGVGKPPGPEEGANHVLRRPGKTERTELDITIEQAADAVEMIVREGVDAAMGVYNQITPEDPDQP